MRSCSRRSKPNPAQKRREEKRRAMAEEDDLEQMVERERKPAELPLLLRFLCWSVTTLNKLGRTRDGRYRRRMTDLLEFKVKANTKPKNGVYTKDVTVDASINLWVRLFVPVEAHSSTESFPVMFYFHGGGFACLSPDFLMYDLLCRRLARRRHLVIVSVNYRRAPENRYPAAYDDCAAAVVWAGTADGRAALPPAADLGRCLLAGDSAGGNIAHHVGVRAAVAGGGGGSHVASVEALKLAEGVRVVGQVLIQPFFGGEGERTAAELRLKRAPVVNSENVMWHWKAFLPAGADMDHPACNVVGPRAPDLEAVALPPTAVVVGGYDPLQDWQLGYARAMLRKGKDVRIMFYGEGIHVFPIFPLLRVSGLFIHDLKDFLRHCWATSAAAAPPA